eukprot:c6672_g1_i1 orf=2-394(+)
MHSQREHEKINTLEEGKREGFMMGRARRRGRGKNPTGRDCKLFSQKKVMEARREDRSQENDKERRDEEVDVRGALMIWRPRDEKRLVVSENQDGTMKEGKAKREEWWQAEHINGGFYEALESEEQVQGLD